MFDALPLAPPPLSSTRKMKKKTISPALNRRVLRYQQQQLQLVLKTAAASAAAAQDVSGERSQAGTDVNGDDDDPQVLVVVEECLIATTKVIEENKRDKEEHAEEEEEEEEDGTARTFGAKTPNLATTFMGGVEEQGTSTIEDGLMTPTLGMKQMNDDEPVVSVTMSGADTTRMTMATSSSSSSSSSKTRSTSISSSSSLSVCTDDDRMLHSELRRLLLLSPRVGACVLNSIAYGGVRNNGSSRGGSVGQRGRGRISTTGGSMRRIMNINPRQQHHLHLLARQQHMMDPTLAENDAMMSNQKKQSLASLDSLLAADEDDDEEEKTATESSSSSASSSSSSESGDDDGYDVDDDDDVSSTNSTTSRSGGGAYRGGNKLLNRHPAMQGEHQHHEQQPCRRLRLGQCYRVSIDCTRNIIHPTPVNYTLDDNNNNANAVTTAMDDSPDIKDGIKENPDDDNNNNLDDDDDDDDDDKNSLVPLLMKKSMLWWSREELQARRMEDAKMHERYLEASTYHVHAYDLETCPSQMDDDDDDVLNEQGGFLVHAGGGHPEDGFIDEVGDHSFDDQILRLIHYVKKGIAMHHYRGIETWMPAIRKQRISRIKLVIETTLAEYSSSNGCGHNRYPPSANGTTVSPASDNGNHHPNNMKRRGMMMGIGGLSGIMSSLMWRQSKKHGVVKKVDVVDISNSVAMHNNRITKKRIDDVLDRVGNIDVDATPTTDAGGLLLNTTSTKKKSPRKKKKKKTHLSSIMMEDKTNVSTSTVDTKESALSEKQRILSFCETVARRWGYVDALVAAECATTAAEDDDNNNNGVVDDDDDDDCVRAYDQDGGADNGGIPRRLLLLHGGDVVPDYGNYFGGKDDGRLFQI